LQHEKDDVDRELEKGTIVILRFGLSLLRATRQRMASMSFMAREEDENEDAGEDEDEDEEEGSNKISPVSKNRVDGGFYVRTRATLSSSCLTDHKLLPCKLDLSHPAQPTATLTTRPAKLITDRSLITATQPTQYPRPQPQK
jgi:hypothetical protein